MNAALVAAFVAFAVTAFSAASLIRALRKLRLVDVPNERSSHSRPTARGGGIAIAAGVAAGTAVLAVAGVNPPYRFEVLLVLTGLVAALGAADDLFHLPILPRLVAQVLVATAAAVLIGPLMWAPLPPPLNLPLGVLATPISIVWLVAVTNFFNFMDGLDGLAGGQAIACCVCVLIAGWSPTASYSAALIVGATCGFLIFNLPRARLFLGDVGSTSLGFVIAALPLLAPTTSRSAATFSIEIALALFLLDPLETLFRLRRRGVRLGSAHRLHSYQLLATTPRSRALVALGLVGAGMILAVGGGLSYRFSGLMWPILGLAVSLFAAERTLAHKSETGRLQHQY